MDEKAKQQLRDAGRQDLIDGIELAQSGYAGMDSKGQILDRRTNPDLMPIPKNSLLKVPEPVKMENRKHRQFALPFDYIFCTYWAFCWLILPLPNGRWLALRRSTNRLRPCAFDRHDKPMKDGWKFVVPQDIHNVTAKREISGRGWKQLKESLFGDGTKHF